MSSDGTWEVQWHPAAGGAPTRWLLTRRRRRGLAIAATALVVVVTAIMSLLPFAARVVLAGWSITGIERSNRDLRRQEASRRELAQSLTLAVASRLDRSRRLAWSLGMPESVWRGSGPSEPAADAPSDALLGWLAAAGDRLDTIGARLAAGRPQVACPLDGLPTALPVQATQAVPVTLYGWRTSPFTGRREPHYGVTLAAPLGQPVTAAGGGTVRYAGTPREQHSNEWTRFGTLVVIDHGGGVASVLGGLATVTVKRGDRVRRGQAVGTVGQSAWSRVPAVYWEVRWPAPGGVRPIDPALVCLSLPLPDPAARFSSPAGDLPDDFARLEHLSGWDR